MNMPCSVCYAKTFKMKADIISHKRTRHKNLLVCHLCDKFFSEHDNMIEHRRVMHGYHPELNSDEDEKEDAVVKSSK